MDDNAKHTNRMRQEKEAQRQYKIRLSYKKRTQTINESEIKKKIKVQEYKKE